MRHVALPHHLYVWADNRYLTGGDQIGITPAVLHGVYGRPGEVILTHLLLETGAHWSGVPLHGVYCKPLIPPQTVQQCQPWGNMGESMEAAHMPYLDGLQVEVKGGHHGRSTGIVLDWTDGFTRHPSMHKPLHLLLMESGGIWAQPNNHLRWRDPSFVDESTWTGTSAYRRGEQTWHPEDR